MCFPNTISEIDFTDSQLDESEALAAVERYYDRWVDEVACFQQHSINIHKGDVPKCSMISCLPPELKKKFYDRYMHLIHTTGRRSASWL